MVEKCRKHGFTRDRPCASEEIANRISEDRIIDVPVRMIFMLVPTSDGEFFVKECYLTMDDFLFAEKYVRSSEGKQKGQHLQSDLMEWKSKTIANGYLVLINRDYDKKESNDGFFIRSEAKRTKFVCPKCLEAALPGEYVGHVGRLSIRAKAREAPSR